VTFDPFYDFETRGYLRNLFGEKDPEIVRHLEHSSFLQGVAEAFKRLSLIGNLSYRDVLETHKTLFGDMYPWAGQDRMETAPDLAVSRGSVLFAHPNDAKIAVDHALRIGQDTALMADKPGEVMGYLAYGHPFLDGNGRTIMVVHTELAERAGISIDWAATDKAEYLTALTRELKNPDKGHLDEYLKRFVGPAIGRNQLSSHVANAPGLDRKPEPPLSANEVVGKFSDPALQARYQHQQQERRGKDGSAAGEPARAPDLEEDLLKAEARAAQSRDPSEDANGRGRPRGGRGR
jgi:cell filamentation protein